MIPEPNRTKTCWFFVDELADSAVVMGLRVWVPTDKYWKIKWRLNEKIKESFDDQRNFHSVSADGCTCCGDK